MVPSFAEAGDGKRETAFMGMGRKMACVCKQFWDEFHGLRKVWTLELGIFCKWYPSVQYFITRTHPPARPQSRGEGKWVV